MTKYLLTDSVKAAWGGETPPELPLIEWAAQFIDKGKAALDIGAHVGSWCLTLADRAAVWYAFEPQRSSYNALCGGIALNHLNERVLAHNKAVYSRPKSMWLAKISSDGGGSHLSIPNHPGKHFGSEMVDAVALDAMAWVPPVGFIKMDVEGSELAVLKGAQMLLRENCYPPIVFECWNHDWFALQRHQLFDFLRNTLGYKLTPVSGWPEMTLAEHQSRIIRP